jgi:hypothetical protein
MKNETPIKIILLIILPLFEIVLRNSQIPFLMQFEVVYLVGILFILINNYRGSVIFVLIASFVVELFSQNEIGYVALAFFIAIAAVNILFSFFSFGKEINRQIMGASVLILSLILKNILIYFFENKNFSLSLSIIIFNMIGYLVVVYISGKFSKKAHVFKK